MTFLLIGLSLILHRDNAGADDVAQDQGEEEREGSFDPLLKKRIWAPGEEIYHVENKKHERAKYSCKFTVLHAYSSVTILVGICEQPVE
jgi:hypothetical protein